MTDQIIVEIEGVGELEFPDGTDPAVIQATVKRMTGGGEDAPKPRLLDGRTDANESLSDEEFIDRSESVWGTPTLPGLTQVGAAAGPLRQLLGKFAPGLMRNALGAQQGIRNKFPTVDLEQVALREGAVPGAKASIASVGAKAKAAGQAVKDTAKQAGPSLTIKPREVVREAIRPLYDDAVSAKRPDVQDALVAKAKQIRSDYGPGLSTAGGQSRKQILQQEGKAAMTAPNPRDAGMGSQMANAERKVITKILRRNPQMEDALNQSQEMIALERAMNATGRRTSLLRDLMAASTGTGAGLMTGNPANALVTIPAAIALNRTITSPQALGRLAQTLNRTGQSAGTGELQALLAQLMASHTQGQE